MLGDEGLANRNTAQDLQIPGASGAPVARELTGVQEAGAMHRTCSKMEAEVSSSSFCLVHT